MTRRGLIVLALALVVARAAAAQPATVPPLVVYAAADLDMAFREIKPLFEKATGARVTLVMGSTGNLAKQIEHGAPADVFFAANESFVDDLRAAGAVIPQTRALYAQGRIVLAVPKKSVIAVRELGDLLKPEVRRVAIANPAHAPYGRAAQEALERAGVWEKVKPKLVYGENIRHAPWRPALWRSRSPTRRASRIHRSIRSSTRHSTRSRRWSSAARILTLARPSSSSSTAPRDGPS
jgi:molybdate transport system substrate-binding protein